MKLGAYTACLHDKPLGQALDVLAGIGLSGVEINSGGFLPAVHLPISDIRASAIAREDYLGEFSSRGLTLTALNCNGNPCTPTRPYVASTQTTSGTPSNWPACSACPGW